jgi:hypothetical protein
MYVCMCACMYVCMYVCVRESECNTHMYIYERARALSLWGDDDMTDDGLWGDDDVTEWCGMLVVSRHASHAQGPKQKP